MDWHPARRRQSIFSGLCSATLQLGNTSLLHGCLNPWICASCLILSRTTWRCDRIGWLHDFNPNTGYLHVVWCSGCRNLLINILMGQSTTYASLKCLLLDVYMMYALGGSPCIIKWICLIFLHSRSNRSMYRQLIPKVDQGECSWWSILTVTMNFVFAAIWRDEDYNPKLANIASTTSLMR